MAEPDDRHWLEALGGQHAGLDAPVSTLKEAAAVRQAMLAARRAPPRHDVEAGTRRLLQRLRAENLLEAQYARLPWKVLALAALAALAIAIGIALREPSHAPRTALSDVPVMTGDPAAAQAIVTPDAREIAEEVRRTMTQAGFAPRVTERGTLTRFEADWPARPSREQLEFLKLYGFARPNGPQLTIEVRSPQE